MIYTIGHSNQSIGDFIGLLKKHDINCLCDVRSSPYSRYTDQFNREPLKLALEENGIYYLFLGESFGARPDDMKLYTNGIVDFSKVTRSKAFQDSVKRVENGLEKGYRIALMCSEKDPVDCHRTIMVSKYFHDYGHEILHILSDGSLKSQEEVAAELVEKYFPNRNQINLFQAIDEIDYVEEAYKKANLEIGYKEV